MRTSNLIFYSLSFSLFLLFSANTNTSHRGTHCEQSLPQPILECVELGNPQSDDGFSIAYFPKSKKKMSEGHYTDGAVAGYWKYFFDNGKVHWEGNYTDGRLDGYFNLFYKSGKVREGGHYEDCLRDGYWNFHFDNARNQVQYQGHFDQGRPVGTWEEFNRSGKLVSSFGCD